MWSLLLDCESVARGHSGLLVFLQNLLFIRGLMTHRRDRLCLIRQICSCSLTLKHAGISSSTGEVSLKTQFLILWASKDWIRLIIKGSHTLLGVPVKLPRLHRTGQTLSDAHRGDSVSARAGLFSPGGHPHSRCVLSWWCEAVWRRLLLWSLRFLNSLSRPCRETDSFTADSICKSKTWQWWMTRLSKFFWGGEADGSYASCPNDKHLQFPFICCSYTKAFKCLTNTTWSKWTQTHFF